MPTVYIKLLGNPSLRWFYFGKPSILFEISLTWMHVLRECSNPSQWTLLGVNLSVVIMKVCQNFWPPESLGYFTTVMSIIFCMFALMGNGLVGILIIIDPLKALQTPANYFIVNLAASDMIVACVTLPLSSYWHYLETMHVRLASHNKVLHLAFFIPATACCLSHVALSLDRYFAVRSSMSYRNNKLMRSCAISILIWLVSGVTPLLYFKLGYVTYLMVFANGALLLTLLVLTAVCIAVNRVLQESEKELVENEKKSQTERRVSVFLELRQKKVTRVFLIVIIVFVICTAPAVVLIYIIYFCEACPCHVIHVIRDVQLLFVMSTSAINPFICTLRLPTFRMSLKKLFTRLCRRLFICADKQSPTGSIEPTDYGQSPVVLRQRNTYVPAVVNSQGLNVEPQWTRSSNASPVFELTVV